MCRKGPKHVCMHWYMSKHVQTVVGDLGKALAYQYTSVWVGTCQCMWIHIGMGPGHIKGHAEGGWTHGKGPKHVGTCRYASKRVCHGLLPQLSMSLRSLAFNLQWLGPFLNLSDRPLTHLGCWPTSHSLSHDSHVMSCNTLDRADSSCAVHVTFHTWHCLPVAPSHLGPVPRAWNLSPRFVSLFGPLYSNPAALIGDPHISPYSPSTHHLSIWHVCTFPPRPPDTGPSSC